MLQKFVLRYLPIRTALFRSVIFSLAFPGGVFGNFITFSVGTSGDIFTMDIFAELRATVDDFQAALGNPNNGNAPGPLHSGRREINWDGGGPPNDTTTLAGTPFEGFLNSRGALFTTPGSGFIQAPPSSEFFSSHFFGPSGLLGTFSPLRIFSPIGSNITDVSFFVPGTNGAQPTTVSAFGAVFANVDLADSSRIQFFDTSNNLLYDETVAPSFGSDHIFLQNLGLSFLGAIGNAGEQIFRVRITSGNTPFSPGVINNRFQGIDLVAMDDFIYSEPGRVRGVPESGSGVTLLGLAVGFLFFCYRRSLAVS
jgi:hypothetical protein